VDSVARWALPWPIKYAFILAIASLVLLLSYHYLVRPSWIGLLLNGHFYPRFWPRGPEPVKPNGDDRACGRTESGFAGAIEFHGTNLSQADHSGFTELMECIAATQRSRAR
jgi:hypothetical protein